MLLHHKIQLMPQIAMCNFADDVVNELFKGNIVKGLSLPTGLISGGNPMAVVFYCWCCCLSENCKRYPY